MFASSVQEEIFPPDLIEYYTGKRNIMFGKYLE
jgi:hypothetical protein